MFVSLKNIVVFLNFSIVIKSAFGLSCKVVFDFFVDFRRQLGECLQSIKKMATASTWRGVPITDIYGSKSPWGSPEFQLVVPSYNHIVLYHVPQSGGLHSDRPPKPQIGHDKWDHDFVRMPCSSHSLYPVDKENGDSTLKKRWEIIESTLSKPIRNSQELAEAIITYNTKFKNVWRFRGLHKLFDEYLEEEESQYFFEVTLPQIIKLVLDLPKLIQSPIPLLRQHKNCSLSLSQQQIASLLANSFFCTFPRRNTSKKQSEYATYPYINFNSLYENASDSTLEKLKCICHYFKRVCTKVPIGVVTFSRRSVPPQKCPDWSKSEIPISMLPVHVDSEMTIEDSAGLIQVDFANKFLGGGVLNHGCVQEEIRFVICPELMVSMLFTEVLRPNEALLIIGCERYSNYTGYGHSFQWAGNHDDVTPFDSCARRRCAVLAIDALPYSSVTQEYSGHSILRELNKAWVGMTFFIDENNDGLQYPGVATGNWGCGAFGGSPELKSLIQMMACAQAKRPMAYYTFNDTELRDEIINVCNVLARYNVTVGQLYKLITRFTTTDVRRNNLHEFIYQALRDDEKAKSTKINSETVDFIRKLPVTNSNLNNSKDMCINDQTLMKQAPIQNSPDLFSQEECEKVLNDAQDTLSDTSMTEVVIEPTTINNKANSEKNRLTLLNQKCNVENNPQTSRLFDEMNKLDEGNGRLNLNDTTHSNTHFNSSMDCDSKLDTDDATAIKKKITKKITDYFSKQPM